MKNKKGFLQGALTGALVTLLGISLVSCGVLGYKNVVSREEERKLSELDSLIESDYLGDVDEDALTEGLYKGYLEALGDPYSEYYDAEETAKFNENMSGEFSGIGVVMSQDQKSGLVTMVQIYKESPAAKAGLKEGDILFQVDGKDVSGKKLDEIVTEIKGEKGTEVKLTVLRGEEREKVTTSVIRDTIEVQTVEYEMMEDQIGYLAVSEFDSVTYEQYQTALKDLEAQGMKGLVIDLRNNPGGNLDIVCEMLDLILPKGLIVYTEDKDGEKQEYTSDADYDYDVPMTVLINGNSASASEIFAGAVQDYGKADIVGTTSYGKGVVQSVYALKDGTCVKLTVAEYFTPKGRSINGKGITPDVEVEYEYNEEEPEADNQLECAVEVLKQKM